MRIFRRHRHLTLELLSEYLDGRLDTAAQARVSRDVDSCEPCRNELDSLQSTIFRIKALPELTAPRSFTLAAPPLPQAVKVRQALPLRAPAWAYAGAASLAGLALAIMVSADTLGLLAPIDRDAFPVQSSERSDQPLWIAAAPEAGSSATEATPQPQIASGEADDAAPPEPASEAEAGLTRTLSATDDLSESTVTAPGMAQPYADEQPGAVEQAVESVPGAADGAELEDPEIEGAGLSKNTADPLREAANLSVDGPPEGEPDSDAVLTPDQYRGTPIIWRVLEGIAMVLFLALLSILAIKRLMSHRIGG